MELKAKPARLAGFFYFLPKEDDISEHKKTI